MYLSALQPAEQENISSIWQSIGYSEEEILQEKEKLSKVIQSAIEDYQNQLSQTYEQMKNQVSEKRDEYKQALQAFGLSEEAVKAKVSKCLTLTIKESLSNLNNEYSMFIKQHAEMLDKFKSVQKQINELFDQLEIEDRGEFKEIGKSDFSKERLSRYEAKISQLNSEISTRKNQFQTLEKEIRSISREIEEEIPPSILTILTQKKVSVQSINELHDHKDILLQTREQYQAEYQDKLKTLQKLWNILDIPQKERDSFVKTLKTVGKKTLSKIDTLINDLKGLRESKLPQIIKTQQEEISKLEKELHLSEEEIEENPIDPENINDFYDWLDQRYETLSQKAKELKPVIELIKQREDLVQQNEQLMEENKKTKDPKNQKKPIDQKQVAKNEQMCRRIKSLLPRIEKKLMLALVEYKSRKGAAFLWDGKPYEDQLAHIKLSNTEIHQATAHKKSISSSSMRGSQVLLSTRSSMKMPKKNMENNRSIGNVKM
ncbi:hypothetical protein GPJ56_006136 [Histomonas meleagridis]|uniref:uncharacterized protein n=1 Tax=Histomonas meleagridis TaxID=135588 RepID=UPI0035595F80|nr:hypothetical protein GPJ56_006136 [Histomonas meleagridis]KAH0797049.1 hypothetical protein GO595_010942 [Histomonas meleagridis]